MTTHNRQRRDFGVYRQAPSSAGRRSMVSRIAAGLCGITMIVIAPTATASATTTKVTLAFDQGYCGNTWRASMDSTYSHEINLLEKQGQVASSTFLCADNSVSTQISQVGDMILDHPSVIVLDPNSTTALNGVIAKAKAAGIPVLITDSGPVTSTIPYQLNTDNWDTMYVQGQYIAQRLHGSGNVLEVRGIPGLANEQSFHEALLAAFKPYPKIHIVASVWGQWDDAVAETKSAAIISSLPTINAVACQGGSYGVIEAFEAAGRPIPVIGGDNRGTFLHWWANEQKKNGYETLSYMTSPGIGAASAWVAAQIAQGKQVPKTMVMPDLKITQATVAEFAAKTPLTGTAYEIYSASWMKQHLLETVIKGNGQGPTTL